MSDWLHAGSCLAHVAASNEVQDKLALGSDATRGQIDRQIDENDDNFTIWMFNFSQTQELEGTKLWLWL